MDVAALCISILALVAAGGAALFTRSQAIATRELADRDAARRFQERRPQWRALLEATSSGPGAPHRLTLELTSPETVDQVRVVSLDASRLAFTDSQEGVDQLGDEALSVRPVRTRRLTDAAWRVLIPDPAASASKARLEVTAKIDGEEWTDVVEADLPTAQP